MRCLAHDPGERPESAAALARQLAAALPEPPTQPLPTAGGTKATEVLTLSLPTRLLPNARSNPLALRRTTAVIGLAAMLALGLALGIRPDRSPTSPSAPTRPRQPQPTAAATPPPAAATTAATATSPPPPATTTPATATSSPPAAAPAAASPSCAQLEQRKQQLENQKKTIEERKKETKDKTQRDALEQQKKRLEAPKHTLDKQLHACR